MTWWEPRGEGEIVRMRAIAGSVQEEVISGEHPQACPAISAWVTSAARVILWRSFLVAGRENVYYTDTDSIHCSQEGYHRLHDAGMVEHGVMGKLRLVDVARVAIYKGPKHYQLDDKLTCSGLVKSSRVNPGDEVSVWIREGLADGTIQAHRPEGRRQRRGLVDLRESQAARTGSDGRIRPMILNER